MNKKVGILGAQNPPALREKSKAYIESNGLSADILTMPTRNLGDFKEQLTEYDALITCGEKVPGEAIQYLAGHKLKLISRCGVGTDEMDKAQATASGVAVCNAAGSLSTTVAECAMGLIINTMRDFVNADKDVRKGDWSKFFESKTSNQLEGKTVGLIGYGDIAVALSKMLLGFDVKVMACDIHFNHEAADKYHVIESDADTIIRESDVISLHVPLTTETAAMVNKEFLKKMKNTAVLINTARGKLVDEQALAEALQTGEIRAAGLDVFCQEPLPTDSPLIPLKNVVLLPHNGSGTEEALMRVNAISAKNAVDFLNGRPVPTILNPDYIRHVK